MARTSLAAALLAALTRLGAVTGLTGLAGLAGASEIAAITAITATGLAVAGCGHPAPARPLPPLPRAVTASYLSGKLAGYKGDWDTAADELAAAAAAAPDQPMIAVELARTQVKAKRVAAALVTLAAARDRWPDHPQVWLVSGDLLATTDRAQATRAYLRAIQLAPEDERAYLGLAKLQPPELAEGTLRILLKHVPASVDGHYRLALRLAPRGELAAAIRELRAVLERDPDHIDARLDLARALRRLGHLDQAIAETRSAFDRSGQALDIAEELFWLLCEADDAGAAIDLLTLLDDDRSDADALAVTARLERGLGRLAEARAIAARIARNHHDAGAIALAQIELAAGNRAAVQATLATIADDSKLAAHAHRLLAEAALAAGDPAAALAALVPRSPTRGPARPAASKPATGGKAGTPAAKPTAAGAGSTSAGAAAASDKAGTPAAKPTAASAAAGAAAEAKADSPVMRAAAAEGNDGDGDGDDGDGSDAGAPASLDSALLVAFALADLGKLADARAVLAPFDAATDPTERQAAILARARLAERAGDIPGALALLEPLIRATPDLVAALNLAGYLLADANQRLADAERYLRHARELSPGDPAILDSWGWLLLRRGNPRAAVRALDHAARFSPLEPEILVHLAAAWAADGAPRTAVAALDRAASLGPSPAVQKRIAAIRHGVAGR